MAQAQVKSLLPEMPAEETATPLMAQYRAIKAKHLDCLVFFRLGDFYELFMEDAVKASKALDIALTRRGHMNGQDIPMCGVPAHSYEGYLAKLIRKGFRVAICEQTEDPAEAKKRGAKAIVTRDVVRIITPGTITEDSLLDAQKANYLACLTDAQDELALSWLDLTSGQPYLQTLTSKELSGALARIDPSELLIPDRLIKKPELIDALEPWRDILTPQPSSRFDSDNGRMRLLDLYKVSELSSFGDFSRAEIAALGALLDYTKLTQKNDLLYLSRPQKLGLTYAMAIDPATKRNLELTRTLTGERGGSLLATIDRTLTGAGARLLASRLVAPLTDISAIKKRLASVRFIVEKSPIREKLRGSLQRAPDLERAIARLALGRGGPRDLASVRDALKKAKEIRTALEESSGQKIPEEISQDMKALEGHDALIILLDQALAPDLPMLMRDGNFIASGFSKELDELISLRDDSRRLIAGLQASYADQSGVTGLKIRHNQVIGYYIEVTPTHADKLLENKSLFIHRQSLASGVRFTTIELGTFEKKVTEASDKALALELALFADILSKILAKVSELRETAGALASLDVAAALAELAVEQNYAEPRVDLSFSFHIKGGRHPVVEQALKGSNTRTAFIANDCDLAEKNRLWLLTGPNMAGKSTFLRQNALIAILAQMGSFVPATEAHIGFIDRLFSRVGAADDLARGHSTFMVEMVETAAILNQSGERSLVILDEIGRGTATYDGLSIAWATIEHLHEVNRCRSLFATHYHELTSLTTKLSALRCYTMRIKEWQKEIIFLHEVAEGVADRSYGIHVAQMAGLPPLVIARAEAVLKTLERDAQKEGANKNKGSSLANELPLFTSQKKSPDPVHFLNAELKKLLNVLKPDEMSPKEALEALYQIKKLDASLKS